MSHRIPKPVKVAPTLTDKSMKSEYSNKATIEELNHEMGIDDETDELKNIVFSNKKKTKEEDLVSNTGEPGTNMMLILVFAFIVITLVKVCAAVKV